MKTYRMIVAWEDHYQDELLVDAEDEYAAQQVVFDLYDTGELVHMLDPICTDSELTINTVRKVLTPEDVDALLDRDPSFVHVNGTDEVQY